jgi:hypothetical protein
LQPPSSAPLPSGAPISGEARPGKSVEASTGAAANTPAKRSIPILVPGLAGGLASATYAHFALGMRLSPPLVMMGLGGLTLVLAAYALWRVLDPLTRDDVRAVNPQRAPLRIRELEREKQTVLKAIKEIELDYQMKKIAEPDYREMVERYRARALRIMGDLAAGDDYRALIERELKGRIAVMRAAGDPTAPSSPSSAPAGLSSAASGSVSRSGPSAGVPDITEKVVTGACTACGIVNDLDARFCKRCGLTLVPGVPTPSAKE